MTYRAAKLYMLCVCYTLRELKDKHGALLAGEAPRVPSRLIDTAALDEVEEAIREYGSKRFATERERGKLPLLVKYPVLVPAHMGPDHDFGKALERGIRGLCVREDAGYLGKLLDGAGLRSEARGLRSIRAERDLQGLHEREADVMGRAEDFRKQVETACGYPWHVARDAMAEELELAVALYGDELYRHLRELAEKVGLAHIGIFEKDDIRRRKKELLAGDDVRLVTCSPFGSASLELLDKALEENDAPMHVFHREWLRYERAKFAGYVYFYFITDGSGMGTLVTGLVAPEAMVPLLGSICLEENDPRQVARILAEEFYFDILAEDEPDKNVAFVQSSFFCLAGLVGIFGHGGVYGIFRVDVSEVVERFSDAGMAAMARSIDRKECSVMLFSPANGRNGNESA